MKYIAQTVNGEVETVYDVTLKSDGVSVQPDGKLTIKLRIPKNIAGKNFNIFHLHLDTVIEMEYTVDGHYAVVTTDKLSEFIFVGEKAEKENKSVDTLWITLVIISSVVVAGVIGFIVYRKVLKNKSTEGKK